MSIGGDVLGLVSRGAGEADGLEVLSFRFEPDAGSAIGADHREIVAHPTHDGRFAGLFVGPAVEDVIAVAADFHHDLFLLALAVGLEGVEEFLGAGGGEAERPTDVATDLKHVDDLHAHYRGTDTLVAVHVGGRTADLRWHEPSLDRLLEVHSTHATSEWFLLDALKRGYRMGVISGSDGVDGRPGASHPGHMAVRNVRGGLTAVTMPALTRPALWSALKSRHCYGTTGPRIILRLSAGDAQMGDEISVDRLPPFDVLVEGTAPLETIDFFRDDNVIATVDLMAAAGAASNAIRISWCGTTAPGNWQRARMKWDGELRVHGARIVEATEWALDTPDEGLREIPANGNRALDNDARVAWRSITAGDWDGVVLTLDDASRAELTFVTEPMTLHARLGDLGLSPRTFVAENPARKVELRRLPAAMPPLGWRGRFEDPAPPQGAHAYWIRVRQSDGAYAWSTPIFTTLDSRR